VSCSRILCIDRTPFGVVAVVRASLTHNFQLILSESGEPRPPLTKAS